MTVALSGYSAYFDASMNKPQNETVVAGYLSTLEDTLAKYGVPFLKMSKFIGRRKEYAHPKWQTESYRAQFISDLASIIRSWTVASVACRMKKDLFEKYNAIYELDSRFNLFALCGRDCAAQVRKYVRGIPSDLPITFVFDRGDEGRPDPILDKGDPYHVQLQACDLSAWELRGEESDFESGKPASKLRKSFLALNHNNKIWKQTLEPDLRGLIEVARIEKRS